MVIKEWSEDDRPRERLLQHGAEALSNAELLAILIGSGSTGESAVDLMKRILSDVDNSLNQLGKLTIHDLCQYNGIGPAKAITILAATELGRRRQADNEDERAKIMQSSDIYSQMVPILRDATTEEAWVLLLNNNHRLIKKLRISSGGLTETLVDIRIVLKEALIANATAIILCHNHPSGNCRPSRADDELTRRLATACQTMRMKLVDHVVIVDGDYYSYGDEGKV